MCIRGRAAGKVHGVCVEKTKVKKGGRKRFRLEADLTPTRLAVFWRVRGVAGATRKAQSAGTLVRTQTRRNGCHADAHHPQRFSSRDTTLRWCVCMRAETKPRNPPFHRRATRDAQGKNSLTSIYRASPPASFSRSPREWDGRGGGATEPVLPLHSFHPSARFLSPRKHTPPPGRTPRWRIAGDERQRAVVPSLANETEMGQVFF